MVKTEPGHCEIFWLLPRASEPRFISKGDAKPFWSPSMKNYPSLLKLLLIIFVLIGCQPRMEPLAPHYLKDAISTDYILERLQDRAEKIKNLKSFTRTTFLGPKLKQSFRQTLLVQNAKSIRVDTYGLFGQAMGVFTFHEGRTVFLDPKKGKYYSGAEVESIMERMLGTRLDFSEHLRIFIGSIPRLEFLSAVDARLNSDSMQYILRLMDRQRGGEVTIWFSAQTLLPLEMKRKLGGRSIYSVAWQDYAKIGDHDFPHLVTLSFPEKQEIIRVKYKNPVINQGLPAETFQFREPVSFLQNK